MTLKTPTTLFAALADETRLRIVRLLTQGELCVCDLMTVLAAPQSKISRHLAYLRRAGLVTARRQGLWMHYRLAKPGSKLHRLVLEALRDGHSEFERFERDRSSLRQNRGCLVGCCK